MIMMVDDHDDEDVLDRVDQTVKHDLSTQIASMVNVRGGGECARRLSHFTSLVSPLSQCLAPPQAS